MRGILKNGFSLLEADWEEVRDGELDRVEESDFIVFKFNEEVEILKVINDSSYIGGEAYVILNRDNESMTVASFMVDLINE